MAGANRLRYLLESEGTGAEQVTITTTGAASPDLQTDSEAGPLKQIARVADNGYGAFAAGAQTQAKARALLLSDRSGADPGDNIPVARCSITPRTGVYDEWEVDANVDGNGNLVLNLSTGDSAGGAGSAYLDIEIPSTIGIGA